MLKYLKKRAKDSVPTMTYPRGRTESTVEEDTNSDMMQFSPEGRRALENCRMMNEDRKRWYAEMRRLRQEMSKCIGPRIPVMPQVAGQEGLESREEVR